MKGNTRRSFIKKTVLGGLAFSTSSEIFSKTAPNVTKPIVISTWKWGIDANAEAWKVLQQDGKAIDAVEQGVRVSESDPNVTSVGYGGLPDREGRLTLDASIMDETGNCGSVAFLESIKNPISVARLVMDKTPHVMLAGAGAKKFALENGFKEENLVTPDAKTKWQEWIKENNYDPNYIDPHNHDTIGMIALDKQGNLSGACTTSGLRWKYHGRVGDSPIIGAGLYVDNAVGGAAATGKGEAVMKMLGSFLIVELMRQGKSPQEACELAIKRIAEKQKDYKEFQVGFIALNKQGKTGAYAIRRNFKYAVANKDGNSLKDSNHFT